MIRNTDSWMELSGISKDLISRLDGIVPNWRKLVNSSKLKVAFQEGILDEFWLLDHIRDENRAKTYRKISDRGRTVFYEITSKLEKSLIDVFTKASGCTYADIDELVRVEEEISKIIKENSEVWKAKNAEEAKKKIDGLFSRAKEKIRERSNAYEAGISNTSWKVSRAIREFDAGKARRLKPMIDYHMSKFRQENKRVVECQEKLLDRFKNALYENPELESSKERLLIDEIKDSLVEEVRAQKLLRKEFVSSIVGGIIDKYGSEELISFMNSFPDISSDKKAIFRKVVGSDFVHDAFLAVASMSCFRGKMVNSLISGLEDLLWMAENKKEELKKTIEAVYKSDVYRFCNQGGVLTALAHVGTWGFCTGFTAAINVIDFASRDVDRFRKMIVAVKLAIFMSEIPICGTWKALSVWALDQASGLVFGKAISQAICEFTETMISDGLELATDLFKD